MDNKKQRKIFPNYFSVLVGISLLEKIVGVSEAQGKKNSLHFILAKHAIPRLVIPRDQGHVWAVSITGKH